ncbi:MAG: hypothetical protein Ct9H300mP1_28810 [Planctomycetaceae bacterium]|nr:MAG: hypothetical protein Ct9H300mP1_28810 [Planctomycetaceae bacterium]
MSERHWPIASRNGPLTRGLLIAVGTDYADDSLTVAAGDTVVCFPRSAAAEAIRPRTKTSAMIRLTHDPIDTIN